ncbi:MAG: hypothetical protein NWR50_02480 [Crocinitomicaceae bacterium]|nr:hypothetical protein [Crocinitomicaceae bacterium]
MKLSYTFVVFLSFFGLTSCIEIIDDITLKNDGSGTLKYTINLSESKVKINSILALDSLDGKKVPSIPEMEERIASFKKKLSAKTGISNVTIESNFTNYIFKLQCDFTNVVALQNALKDVIEEESKEKNITELDQNWLSWDGLKMTRSIPEITVKKTKEIKAEDIELMKQGNYTSITRFERAVEKFDNAAAVLSKNKMAVMIKTNPYALTQNSNILENSIYLSPIKN